MCKDSCTYVAWLIRMCNSTRTHVWHDAFTDATGLMFVCDMTHSRMCHMIHPYVWHDSLTHTFIRVTWLIHTCDMTHSYMWHDSFTCVTYSFIYVTWLIRVRDTTHSYVWHDAFTCVSWLIHIFDRIHLHMCNTTSVWHDFFTHMYMNTVIYIRHTYVDESFHICSDTTSLHIVTRLLYTCVTWLTRSRVTHRIRLHTCEMTHKKSCHT